VDRSWSVRFLALILVPIALGAVVAASPAHSSASTEPTDVATIMIRDQTVPRNAPILFKVVAPDPPTGPSSLTYSLKLGNPAAIDAKIDPSTGAFSWTPTATQAAGIYPITVSATRTGSTHEFASGSFTITVLDANAAPIARISGTSSGVTKAFVHFDGSASKDPSGGPLTYDWDFGDGDSSNSVTPTHAYSNPGIFNVKLRVRNRMGVLGEDATTAVIAPFFSARVNLVPTDREMEFDPGEDEESVRIEPAGDAFSIWDVDLSSIRILDHGRTIPAEEYETSVGNDDDRDGVLEVTAYFRTSRIQGLLAGKQDHSVLIAGTLLSGGGIQGSVVLHDAGTSSSKEFSASVSPNPMNPAANLHFKTSRTGSLSVALFDPQGRLVRTFLRDATAAAGDHSFQIEACDARGSRLPSGVYYLKIQSSTDGELTKTIAVIK